MLKRPRPPKDLAHELRHPARFAPAPEVEAWARAALITPGGPITNPDHAHLQDASIGFLWTNVANARGGRGIAGQAEMPAGGGKGGKWQKARAEHQLLEWFGDVPDFLITIDAPYAALIDDATWCALVDHELYHCGQLGAAQGEPKFHNDGSPWFSMRAHDAEEFVGVVRRWGVGAAAAGVGALVTAAKERPTMGRAALVGACGTCLRAVA